MKPYASWEYVDWKHTLETISLDWKQKKYIGNNLLRLETKKDIGNNPVRLET